MAKLIFSPTLLQTTAATSDTGNDHPTSKTSHISLDSPQKPPSHLNLRHLRGHNPIRHHRLHQAHSRKRPNYNNPSIQHHNKLPLPPPSSSSHNHPYCKLHLPYNSHSYPTAKGSTFKAASTKTSSKAYPIRTLATILQETGKSLQKSQKQNAKNPDRRLH